MCERHTETAIEYLDWRAGCVGAKIGRRTVNVFQRLRMENGLVMLGQDEVAN